jgi:hypothetical protein
MSDYSNCPVIDGTIRSGVILLEGEDIRPLEMLRHIFPPIVFLVALVLLIRGHRANFLYTYVVANKYFTAKANRFVRSTKGDPRLFGRDIGGIIRLRYNPEKPNLSVALQEDNPPLV